MKTPYVPPARRLPFAILGCVAFALAACEPKTTAADPAKERQLQEMQAKLDALSAQSSDLNKQLADRETSEAESRRAELEKDQADLEKQRSQLEADRQALADATPAAQIVSADNQDADEDEEPVYQGKPANYDVFYTKLQDDGDWIDSDEYGYIWQPNVAVRNASWRPYSDGRWVETDRGWTWDSRERFGWATYHYGRWVNLRSGWCWVPGEEWAPAWVSWRSNDRYVGWAPLPPEARISRGGSIDASQDVGYNTGPGCYNFVDTEEFGEETYLGRIVEPGQNVTIVNQTVNVTNITYNERNIHNYGPDYDSIRRRSRRPVDRYQLDLNRSAQFDRDASTPRPRGDRLAVIAPLFVASNRGDSNVRPAKVNKKITKADRDDGWRDVNPAQRQAVKADLAKQADRQAQKQQTEREQQRQAKTRQEARAARQNTAGQPAAEQPKPEAQRQPNPPANNAAANSNPDRKPANQAAITPKPNRPDADNAAQKALRETRNQAEALAEKVKRNGNANDTTEVKPNRPAAQPNPAAKANIEAQRRQRQAAQAAANQQKAVQVPQEVPKPVQPQIKEQPPRKQQQGNGNQNANPAAEGQRRQQPAQQQPAAQEPRRQPAAQPQAQGERRQQQPAAQARERVAPPAQAPASRTKAVPAETAATDDDGKKP